MGSISAFLSGLLKKKDSDLEKFNSIMEFASKVLEKNKYALVDVVKSLSFPIQYIEISNLMSKDNGVDFNFFCDFFWDDTEKYVWTEMRNKDNKVEAYDNNSKNFNLDLKRDIVIPTMWNRERLLDALTSYGAGKNKVSWRQDDNHRVEAWLPWGISVVDAGNHSIAAGIISGDGCLVPDRIYDLSGIFDLVKCDGKAYTYIGTERVRDSALCHIHIMPNDILSPVDDINTACIFEIGRMMVKNGVHAWQNVNFVKASKKVNLPNP
jgi:hypothetical protein